MSESNLYNQFRNNWKPNYIKRIEPGSLGQGFPDCHLVNNNKIDIFLELKYLSKDFKNKKLPIRNSQIIWFLEYPGTNAFFLFKIEKLFFLVHKKSAIFLKDKITWDSFNKLAIFKTKDIKEIILMLNMLK